MSNDKFETPQFPPADSKHDRPKQEEEQDPTHSLYMYWHKQHQQWTAQERHRIRGNFSRQPLNVNDHAGRRTIIPWHNGFGGLGH